MIVGMAVINFAIRFVPITLVSRQELPAPVTRWLSYVPSAVMGALVADEVLRPEEALWLSPVNPYLLAAVLTALVYKFTRSFLGATLAGMVAFVALRHALPPV